MLRQILLGLWVCAVSLGATNGGFIYKTRPAPVPETSHEANIKAQDLKTITVPIIQEGQIRGYISADFSVVVAQQDPHEKAPETESYVLDEAYRLIYAESTIEFQNIQKTDLTKITSEIKSRVNTRLGRDAIKDVLVRGFHYVPREEAQK
jgi:hypothetical protein